MVKHLPTVQETQVRSLGREGPLEKEMAIHSSTLAWKIPWMEESGRLQSMGSQTVRHDWATSLHLVVRVIRLTNFLWLWFQCVCSLMPSLNTYRLTWVSLTLDVGYLFTAAPAKRSCCSLPWMKCISSWPPSWAWTWSSSSRPSCARAAAVAMPFSRGSSQSRDQI